jgi:hypothetical protein
MEHQLETRNVLFWSEGVCVVCGTRAFVLGGTNRLLAGFDKVACE